MTRIVNSIDMITNGALVKFTSDSREYDDLTVSTSSSTQTTVSPTIASTVQTTQLP